MSEFLAEAQVNIRANTKQFIADFEKAIKQVEKTKVTVTVRATMTGFRSDLDEKLKRSTKGLVVRPLVRADLTGFRADLEAKVLRASKGIVATVNVKAGKVTQAAQTGAAAGAAAGGGITTKGVIDKRAAAAQLAVNSAVDAGVAARRRITAAISDEEKFASRLEREELHLAASIEAVSKAAISGAPELLDLAQAEERAARAALALSAAQAERRALGVPIGVSTADFKAQLAAMEDIHAAALAENTARDRATKTAAKAAEQQLADMAKLHTAALRQNRDFDDQAKAAAKAAKAAERERLLGSASNLTRERNARGQFIAGGGAAIGAEAAQRNQAVNEALKKTEAVQTELAKARRISASAALVELDAERQLVASRSVLRLTTEAVVVAEEALEAALASGSVLTIQNARASLERAAALQAEAAAETKAAGAAATRAGLLTTGRRALVAQIANLTGLRGAALTAASGFIAVSAAVIGLRKAVQAAAALQSELAVFQVTAGASAEQMAQVDEKARELGKDITLPGVGAQDAAVALTELSKAGLGVQDSIDGARGVLQLATAANIDFTQATQLAASALNAFGLRGEEATHVADVLANSANESQGSITDAGVALQQSAAVARQAGLSLEQTVAALTLFARAGLRGSDAGTSLRTALIRLINPSQKAQETIDKLGLKIRDANGAIDLGVFQQFTDATKKLTKAQRDQALAIVFGQDAIRGAAILAREGSRGLNSELAAINKTGTAARVASARTSGYAGAVENLNNQVEALGEQIGTSLLPALTGVVSTLAESVGAISDTLNFVKQLRKAVESPIDIVIRRIFKTETEGKLPREIDPQTGEFIEPTQHKPGKAETVVRTVLLSTPVQVVENLDKTKKKAQEVSEVFAQFGEDLTGLDLSAPVTLGQAMDRIKKDVADINKSKISPEVSNTAVEDLRKVAADLRDSSLPVEQQLGKQVDDFIAKLQQVSAHPRVVSVEARFLDENFTKQVDAARIKVNDLVDELNKSKDKANFAPTIQSLKDLQQELLHSGRTSSREFARDMQGAIDAVQRAADKPVFVHIKVPENVSRLPELEKGFKRGGFLASKAFWDSFKQGVLEAAPGAAKDTSHNFLGLFIPLLEQGAKDAAAAAFAKAKQGFAASAKRARTEQNAGVTAATTQGENQAAGFDRRILDAQLAKNVKAEIDARKAAIASRQREIARIEKATHGAPQDEALKQITAAKQAIQQQQDAIDSLLEKQQSDREQKAKDLKEKRDKADQAFLDALAAGRTPAERRLARAQATEGVDDNIAALVALRTRLQAEVDAVSKGVQDSETKKKRLQELSEELFQNSLDIEAARRERDDAIRQALQDKGTALQDLGEATGNFKLVLKGLDLQIQAAKQLLAKAKQDATVQKQAATAITNAGASAHATTQAASTAQKKFVVGKPKGLLERGNIDILHRPSVPTPGKKGFTSSVRSITVGIERQGKELFALIPTVIGKSVVSNQAAIAAFNKTGKNLGIFTTEKLANAYAATLHNQQAGLTSVVNKTTTDLVSEAISTGTQNIVSQAAVTQAQANVAKAMKARIDFINQTRQDLLQSAFSLAEAKGNKSLMEQIIDLQIAEQKRLAAKAKTLPEKWAALAEVFNLVQKKKDILAEDIKKEQEGTTVLDLLQQGVKTFNASAGNLINADQPFVGPHGFNEDIAQFLKFRKQKKVDLTDVGVDKGLGFGQGSAFSFARGGFQFPSKDPLVNQLIAALQGLTAATLAASGNSSTSAGGVGQPVVKGSPWAGKPWFRWGANSRAAQES